MQRENPCMAMTKTLYSINALSTELGRDRRTVANALAGVPADGTVNGHKGWHLTTALEAIDPRPEPGRRRASEDAHLGPLWHFASRLEDWEEIRSREPLTRTVEEIAPEYRVTVETVLTWLRAGMPYVQAGDWRTGEGFVLRP